MSNLHRPVMYRKWSQVKPEDLKIGQSPRAYVWSKEQYYGIFLDFVSAVIIDELVVMGLIQDKDGHILQVPLDQFSFTDL